MALMETVTATILGGGFALLGSWMTNRFNKQNAEAQRKHEKWKAKRDSYLTKGEETYSIFNQWMINAAKITTMYAFRMNGTYDAEQLESRLKTADMHGMTPKLTALIEIYFPELSIKFKKIQKIVFEIHMYYAQNLKEAPNSTVSTEIVEQGSKFAKEAALFLEELGTRIKSHQ